MQLSLEFFRLAAQPCVTKTGIIPTWYDGLCSGADGEVKINAVSDVAKIVANVTQIGIAISGGLVVILILAASIYYITSTGDPGRIKQAKDMIQNTATGLVLIVMAYALVGLISAGL